MPPSRIGPRRDRRSIALALCVLGGAIVLTVTAVPLVLLAARAQARATEASGPFTVAVNTSTIEAGPVYVLAAGPNGARIKVINGGVRDLAITYSPKPRHQGRTGRSV